MKILITEPDHYSLKAIKTLKNLGGLSLGPVSREQLLEQIEEISVLVVRLGHNIDSEVLKKAKKLKFILTPTTGLNHIDTLWCEKNNIRIISLFGETSFLNSIPSTAEHTWALLMSMIRMVPAAFNSVKQGDWNRNRFRSHNLNALSIGILGLGRVGNQIAKIAAAFNMKVYAYDVKKLKPVANITYVDSMNDLLTVSDILSIHVNYHEGNKYLINKEHLKYAKAGMYLVNTSRGELINELDLVTYLNSGQIKAVAVDVLDNELDDSIRVTSPLLKYAKNNDNIIITPHIAGITSESMHATEEFVVHKLVEILKNE